MQNNSATNISQILKTLLLARYFLKKLSGMSKEELL